MDSRRAPRDLPLAALTVAVVVALLVGLAPPAAAGDERATVVIDVSGPAKANSEIARSVVRALSKHPEYPAKDIHAVLNAGAEVEDQNNIKTGQAFQQAGVAALEGDDAEDAEDQLESAARLLEQSFAFLRDVNDYRSLLLQLGVARFRNDDAPGAKAIFGRSVLFKTDPAAFPLGDAQATYDEAVAEVAAADKGAVVIETDPPFAEVYVNGRYRGISPATVAGLPVGDHIVAVFKPGWARKTATVTSSLEGLQERQVSLESARRQLSFDELRRNLVSEIDEATKSESRQGGDGVRAAGALLFSEVAIVVRASGPKASKQVELYAFDTGSRRLLKHVSSTVDWSSRNRKSIKAMVSELLDFDYAAALGGATQDPNELRPEVEEDDSVVTKWWFWTIIGVGVAGVAGGTAAAVILTGDDGPPPTTGSMAVQF